MGIFRKFAKATFLSFMEVLINTLSDYSALKFALNCKVLFSLDFFFGRKI